MLDVRENKIKKLKMRSMRSGMKAKEGILPDESEDDEAKRADETLDDK